MMSLLVETHHASRENDIEGKAVELAKFLIQNVDKAIIAQENNLTFNTPDSLPHILLNDGTRCAYIPNTNTVSIGIERITNAAQNNDIRRLASLIFHEMGHQVNVVKSNKAASEIVSDFEKPFFFKMPDNEYKDTLSTIYIFYTRELKARCFEATMFLKQSDVLPSLEEYYSDRCTDITRMKNFIERLENAANQGKDGPDAHLIKDIATEMNRKKVGNTHVPESPSFNSQSRMVIGWFKRQFDWFKRRIDKIYADAKMQGEN